MKQVIAIDIDDVLADNAAAFVQFSNTRWGTNLTVDDYQEHWGIMWETDDINKIEERATEYHASGTIGRYAHRPEARSILQSLSKKYELVVVTSRRSVVTNETKAWINQYYKGLFKDIVFAGFFDTRQTGRHLLTKAELCKSLGASYLIDDQLKHCLAAAEEGIDALLFGDYTWNQSDKPLPKQVTRVKDWAAVARYFDV